MSDLDWRLVAALCYGGCYLALLTTISCITYDTTQSKTKWVSTIWKKRSIYGQTIIHIYDTATDVGVILIWYDLAFKEQKNDDFDVAHVDMMQFFILGLVFIVLYRIFAVIGAFFVYGDSINYYKIPLAFFDLLVFVEIWEAHQKNEDDLGDTNLVFVVIGESVTESVPQMLLQSVFLIRTWNESSLTLNETLFVFLSIIASLMSITGKYTLLDRYSFGDECETSRANVSKFKQNTSSFDKYFCCGGFMNFGYWFRIIWRFCLVTTKISIYVLMSSVVGGWYLAFYTIFEGLSCIVIGFCGGSDEDIVNKLGTSIICMVTICNVEKIFCWIIRFIDNMLVLELIAMFCTSKFECYWCADPNNRNVDNNLSVLIFLSIACGCAAIAIFFTPIGQYCRFIDIFGTV